MPVTDDVLRERIRARIAELQQRVERDQAAIAVLRDILDEEDPDVEMPVEEDDRSDIPYRLRSTEVTEFVQDHPGLTSTEIIDRMISGRRTNASRSSLMAVISRMFSQGLLDRSKDFRYSLKQKEEPDDDEDVDYFPDDDYSRLTMAGAIRKWLSKNPDSSMEQIRDALAEKVTTQSPFPRQAIYQSVMQQIGASGRIVESNEGTYRLAEPPSRIVSRKLHVDDRIPTSKLIMDCVKENPGLKNYEIADRIIDQIDTVSKDKRKAGIAGVAQLKFQGRLEEREADNTYWLPGKIDESVPPRRSNEEERADAHKLNGVLSVLKVAEVNGVERIDAGAVGAGLESGSDGRSRIAE